MLENASLITHPELQQQVTEVAIYREAYYHLSSSSWVTLEFLHIRPLKLHLSAGIWQGKETIYLLWLLMGAVEAVIAAGFYLFIWLFALALWWQQSVMTLPLCKEGRGYWVSA